MFPLKSLGGIKLRRNIIVVKTFGRNSESQGSFNKSRVSDFLSSDKVGYTHILDHATDSGIFSTYSSNDEIDHVYTFHLGYTIKK